MIYKDPLALGLVFTGLGFLLWGYRKMHRFTAWFIGVGSCFLTVAIVPWRNALASLVGSTSALVVLLGLTVAAIIAFGFEAVAKHKHHRIRTPVIAATLGVVLVLAYADGSLMVASLGKSTTRTGTAFSAAAKTIHSGAAAKAAQGDHRYLPLVLGAGVLFAVVALGIRMDKKKTSGPAAITGRRPSAPLSIAPRPAALARGKARR